MVDKLIVLSPQIRSEISDLARQCGSRGRGWEYFLDLRQTKFELQATVHCNGRYGGLHKIDPVGVARLGATGTVELLGKIIGDLSGVRIYRIDFCVDLLGFSIWDLARMCYLDRVQSYQVYRNRKGDSVYLQRSNTKSILIYDKGRALRNAHSIWAPRQNEAMARLEVQLKGAGVLFKQLTQIPQYLDVDLLSGLQFRRVMTPSEHKRPLRSMAAAHLVTEVEAFGLNAVLKQHPSSERAYIKKLFLDDIQKKQIPDIRGLIRKSIEDWLNDRIRFPRPIFTGREAS